MGEGCHSFINMNEVGCLKLFSASISQKNEKLRRKIKYLPDAGNRLVRKIKQLWLSIILLIDILMFTMLRIKKTDNLLE